jgi:hypothetical protein
MKRTFLFHTFFWCILLGLAFSTVAQDHSFGRDPNPQEQKIENQFNATDLLQTAAYGTNASANNTLTEFDLPAGTEIGPIGTGDPTLVQGADFGPGGVYYGTQNNTDLISIDIGTGAYTFVATITGITAGQTITGVGYDETNNIMYLGTTNITTSELYTLDVGTGAATLVGPIGQAGLITIAVDCAGGIYSADLVTDDLWSINPATGVGTVIGPLGIDINFCQDADIDPATGVMWFAAYSAAGVLGTVDLATGLFTAVNPAISGEFCSFAVSGSCGPPCPVGQATNPSPPNGAIDIPITGNTATWDNGAGATSIEVFFDGVSVYTGVPITTLSLAGVEPLSYSTTYTWKVNGSDGNCTTFGPTWSFTTMDDPDIVELFCDDFTAGLGNWTITNDGGTCVWDIFQASDFTMPPTAVGNVMAADADFCGSGTTLLSTATVTGIDATLYQTVWLEFDNDWQAIDTEDFAIVDVSTDGGATWQNVLTFDVTDVRNTHEVWPLTALVGLSTFDIRFVSIQPGWDWWWAVDNVCVYGSDPIPVELTSFVANVNNSEVTLNWVTASEINNQGFEIERNSGNGFENIGYVAGFGTSNETHSYSYVDNSLNEGTYSYRLKQVDYSGTFEYSDVVEVEVSIPDVFTLEQNYPNPFNPSTKINFSLAVDSKVNLKVFDVLGQEVATLISSDLVAGSHKVDFDASSLNSGVYFYKIEATGIDGTNFTNVKKMILTK